MGLEERVRAFIVWRAAKPTCDACAADYLALTRKQVCAANYRVGRDAAIHRFAGRCSGCCTSRTVTAFLVLEPSGAGRLAMSGKHRAART